MIEIDIPGSKRLQLEHLVLDVNGTLALDGVLLPGVDERLDQLRDRLDIHLLTANTHERQHEIDRQLGLTGTVIPAASPLGRGQGALKAAIVEELGAESVVAIGNGNIDFAMIERAGLGIAVLGREGMATLILAAADLVCAHINDALDLLLYPDRLRATLRP